MDLRDEFAMRVACPPHDWESGYWGVIIGASRCLRCRRVSRAVDFEFIADALMAEREKSRKEEKQG